eukprot:CAMPEP_0113615888 /NCGR_PEP_ID=MMETSP0017_2-20120614/7943_1 /TAXON_ID=2856 /ORGANISM="Cylindrotheca closterium" /LENGTH=271 /DNA_ID=CAMNT_0000525159 /DNA_START=178 /DNA_END=993 /DNA_ORIENTATION=+ /assembly_acc=CAM_ASM_000147
MSVFILSGAELKATARLEGPIAPASVDDPEELYNLEQKFIRHNALMTVNEVVDFEHMNESEDEEEESSEDEEPIDPDDPDADEKKRMRRQKNREKFMEIKRKKERKRISQHKRILKEGEPFIYTAKAAKAGWYRACLEGTWNQVIAEFEMRKQSRLGHVDEEGHVITWEMKDMLEEDEELEKDTASQEGIKDEDFQATREKVKELRRLLNEIQGMQQKERRRLAMHAETNEHSHSRMVLSSLLETLLFMAVTGYQVYTIRHWFSGAPALGR